MGLVVLRASISGPAILFFVAAMLALFPQASAQEVGEYQVKAAFLYNFTKFVDWPPLPGNAGKKQFEICVFGDDPFRNGLESIVEGKSVNGQVLEVRHIKKVEDAQGCKIAFISSSEKGHLRTILNALRGSGMLTVGDTEGFARMGGVINFTLVDNHVHIEINPEAAKVQKLKISSRLLRLAQIVQSGDTGG
ncbi:MAG TPA: YfiR family protein [Terriglobia bacterium]|nr:YfiR family protein [Terriglobia bacterium]